MYLQTDRQTDRQTDISTALMNSYVDSSTYERIFLQCFWIPSRTLELYELIWGRLGNMRFLQVNSFLFYLENRTLGYPAQPEFIRPSVRPSVHPSVRPSIRPYVHSYVCTSVPVCPYVRAGLQIRYWVENCTGQTDLVNYSSKSWIHVNRESEILQNKVHEWE